ncbi:MAG: hypothetical protein HQ574_02785 [Chloroflexi bacterium]|nr:hypothetical protein [Chloroflexota bacterium]
MNKKDFELLLEKCSQQLEEGKPLVEILREHKDQAKRLEPLLQAVLLVRSMPRQEASKSSTLRGKNRLLNEVDQLQRSKHFLKNGTKRPVSRYSERWLENIGNLLVGKENIDMKLVPRLALYLLFTILIGGFFTVNASASSLPGDGLYGLKLSWEQAQLALTFNDDTKLEREAEFEEERISEVQSLLGEGRIAKVEFYGLVETIEGDAWTISGITVLVGPGTELKGTLDLGSLVKVEAVTQENGSLLAIEIYPASADQSSDSSDDDLVGSETPEFEDESETAEVEDENETQEVEDGSETQEVEDESETPDDDSDETDEPDKTPEPEESDQSDDNNEDDDKDDDND